MAPPLPCLSTPSGPALDVLEVRTTLSACRRRRFSPSWAPPAGIEITIPIRAIPLFVLVFCSTMLSGCLSNSIPSSAHPTCSWTTQPPAQAASVCRAAYGVLRQTLAAGVRQDREALRRLVVNGRVRARIFDFGTAVRRAGDISVHITPSFTLAQIRGNLGAGFNIAGKTRRGTVKAPQTVYLRAVRGRLAIVDDQPDEEW